MEDTTLTRQRERWRRIRGWPGYRVSDRGRVRSVPRTLADGREHPGGLLAQAPDKDGYLTVHLRDGERECTVPVHVLVAGTFPCWEGLEVRHLNGKTDNRWTSLRWGTHRENEQDKRKEQDRTGRSAEIGRGSRPFPVVTPVSAAAGGA
jgi:hypothetical protein